MLSEGLKNLCRAILLQALADVYSEDEDEADEAMEWLAGNPPNKLRCLILELTTNLHQDDIDAYIARRFEEE
ncbi:MAG: hypothetical protein GY906_28410 [bacterium]|nr:hypothetical protein [bacterium]